MHEVRIVALAHQEVHVAAAIHAVQMAAYAQEAALLQALHFPPLQRTVAGVQRSTARFVGAWLGDTLAGAIAWTMEPATNTVDIVSLVVGPAHQRRGIARALLGNVFARCGTAAATVSTGAKNAPALALYAALGFIEHQRCVVGPEPLELVKLRRRPSAPAS